MSHKKDKNLIYISGKFIKCDGSLEYLFIDFLYLIKIFSNSDFFPIYLFFNVSKKFDIISNCFFKSFKQLSQNFICSLSLYKSSPFIFIIIIFNKY